MKDSEQAHRLWPFLLPLVQRASITHGISNGNGGGSGGGGSTTIIEGATNLNDLEDVLLTSLADGHFLSWDVPTSKWQNVSLTGSGLLTAGNGIDITGSVISAKLQAAGGLLADSSGLTVKRPGDSGLWLDSNGLMVGAGDGIDVLGSVVAVDMTDLIDTSKGLYEASPNTIGVNLPAASGLMFDGSGALKMGVPESLTYATPNEVTATGHRHDVLSSSNVGATPTASLLHSNGDGSLTLGPLTLYGNLGFLGGDREITASNTLALKPLTNLRLDPVGVVAYANSQESRTDTFNDFVAGIYGLRLFDPTYTAPGPGANTMLLVIGGIKADELSVKKFTADEARVNRGEEFWARSFGIVQEAFTLPADEGTVDVWFEEAPGLGSFKLFLPDNWLLLRTIDWSVGLEVYRIWFQVVDADGAGVNDWVAREAKTDTVPSRQQWRLRRKFSLLAMSAVIKPGEVIVDFGQPNSVVPPGQGVVHLSALSKDGGPFVQIQTFENVIADVPQFKNRVRMGNLSGTVDYSSIAWGFAAGDDLSVLPSAGFSGVAIDQAAGARFFNTDIRLYESAILSSFLSRDHGLSLRNDTTLFGHDLRNIAWYDSLPEDGDLSALVATARMGSWGTSEDRRLVFDSYGSNLSGIFLTATGDSGADIATFALKGGGWYSRVGGVAELVARYFNVASSDAPHVKVGGDLAQFATSNLHVYTNDNVINDTAGITMEQDGTGDATIHWKLSGGQEFVAGIDNSDGDKWKLNAGTTLGGISAIVIDPTTGVVTINGLSGSGTGSLTATAGTGISLSGTEISVNATVVRTDRIIGAGDGLQGGGDLSANRTIAVDTSVVRTGLQVNTTGALSGGGDLSTNRTIALNLAGYSGLTQTTTLAVADSLAGAGLLMSATKIMSVDVATVFSGRVIVAGSGLTVTAGGALISDPTLNVGAGFGITVAADTVAVDSAAIVGIIAGYSVGAGDGLTGGGLLTTSPTLNVGAGDGITVSTNDIAVNATVVRTTYAIGSGDGLTGGGDLSTPRTLHVGAGDGITVDVDSVAVDVTVVRTTRQVLAGAGLSGGGYLTGDVTLSVNQDYAFTWTGAHIWDDTTRFNVDPQVNADLAFTGAGRVISAESNLTIVPSGDLILNPTGTDVLPGGSVAIDLGDYNRKWKSLFVGELVADVLVAQSVMATIGGRIAVAPTTMLVADLLIGVYTIHVKHNIFDVGDFARLETAPGGAPQTEVIEITAGPSGTAGDYSYTVTRNLDATGIGANDWQDGDSLINLGHLAGEGYIDLTSTQTVFGHSGPTVTVYARPVIESPAVMQWDDLLPVVTMGNLEGFVGYGVEYGFAVGNDLTLTPAGGFSGLTADAVAGLRMYNTAIDLYRGGDLVSLYNSDFGLAFELSDGADPWLTVSWHTVLEVDPADPLTSFTSTVVGHVSMRAEDSENIMQLTAIGAFATPFLDGRIRFSTGGMGSSPGTFVDITKGKVGINTNDPTATLHVGNYPHGSITGIPTGIISSPNGAYSIISARNTTGTEIAMIAYETLALFGTFSNHTLYFRTNNADRAYLTNGGYFGVGGWPYTRAHVYGPSGAVAGADYDAVYDVLTVENNTHAFLNITAHSTTNSGILFSDHDRAVGQIQYSHPDNAMFFVTAGVVRAFIDGNGRIGVGTTSPSFILDTMGRIRSQGTAAGSGGMWLTDDGTSVKTFIGRDGSGFSGFYDQALGNWQLVLKDNGNVGIGHSHISPQTKLHVVGPNGLVSGASYLPAADVLSVENNDVAFINIIANPAAFCGILFSDTTRARGNIIYSHVSDSLTFNVSGLNRVNIFSDGSVNIPYIWDTPLNGTAVHVSSPGILTKTTSSLRHKRKVRPASDEYGSDFLARLQPVLYREKRRFVGTEMVDFRDDEESPDYVGLIAEDVYAAGGQSFITLNNDGLPDSLHYDRLVAPLILGWQHHELRIAQLEREIKRLKEM